jgi:hypothetical protein
METTSIISSWQQNYSTFQDVIRHDFSFIFSLSFSSDRELQCKNLNISSWQCRDSRFYIKQTALASEPTVASYPATCLWYRNYSLAPANFECRLHHCSHPHVGESSYLPPPTENQLQLVVSQSISDNLVPLGSNISYSCILGTFIESSETDPSRTQVYLRF